MEKGQLKMLTRCLLFTLVIVLLEIQRSQSCSLEPCTPTEKDKSKVAAAVVSTLLAESGLESDDAQDRVKIAEVDSNFNEKRQSDENVNRRFKLMHALIRKPNSH